MLNIFSIIFIAHEIRASTESIIDESTPLQVKVDIHTSNSKHHDGALLQDQSSEEDNKKIDKSQFNVVINVDNIDTVKEFESIALETMEKQAVPQFTNHDEDLNNKTEENQELKKNFFIKIKESYYDKIPKENKVTFLLISCLALISSGATYLCITNKELGIIPIVILMLLLIAIMGGVMDTKKKNEETQKLLN